MDGRLGLPENKAMKLLICAFFTLLLLGFTGGSYGQETIRYSNADIYVGEFKDDQRNEQHSAPMPAGMFMSVNLRIAIAADGVRIKRD